LARAWLLAMPLDEHATSLQKHDDCRVQAVFSIYVVGIPNVWWYGIEGDYSKCLLLNDGLFLSSVNALH